MKILNSTLLLVLILAVVTGCKDDSDDPIECVGLLNNGGTFEVDDEMFNLSIAQLSVSTWVYGDLYAFQVGGLDQDCSLTSLRFSVEITTNTDLDGTYEIEDFFNAGLNDVSGVSITKVNTATGTQSITEISSGSLTVLKLGEREYEVDLSGTLVGGGSIEASFRNKF